MTATYLKTTCPASHYPCGSQGIVIFSYQTDPLTVILNNQTVYLNNQTLILNNETAIETVILNLFQDLTTQQILTYVRMTEEILKTTCPASHYPCGSQSIVFSYQTDPLTVILNNLTIYLSNQTLILNNETAIETVILNLFQDLTPQQILTYVRMTEETLKTTCPASQYPWRSHGIDISYLHQTAHLS